MKKTYVFPELDVERFLFVDILTASEDRMDDTAGLDDDEMLNDNDE